MKETQLRSNRSKVNAEPSNGKSTGSEVTSKEIEGDSARRVGVSPSRLLSLEEARFPSQELKCRKTKTGMFTV